MVATELMVGDWVYAIDANGEKHPCRANNLEYDYTNKRGDFCVDFYGTGYEAEWPDVAFNVEPIPLTPEILEKNGFEYYHKNFASIDYDSPFKLEMVEWPDENGNGGLWLIKGLFKIRFVHELQHALKLCGIDKEIVL